MNDNNNHLHYIYEIREMQREMEMLGMSETSEILKLAVISLYGHILGNAELEKLLEDDSLARQANN